MCFAFIYVICGLVGVINDDDDIVTRRFAHGRSRTDLAYTLSFIQLPLASCPRTTAMRLS